MTEIAEGVVADPEVMHGKPVIKGTRIPVEVVLNTLAEGIGAEEVCEEFGLEERQVSEAVKYAAERVSEEEYRPLQA